MAGGHSLAFSVFGLPNALHQLYKNRNINTIYKVIWVDFPGIAASGLHLHSCVIGSVYKPNHSRAIEPI